MQYWLMKSEPTCFSIDDLIKSPNQTTYWYGVRNYQARNFMKNDMKIGDQVFFYHSNCNPPGIVGIAEVVSEAYPDFTAFDPFSEHPDPKSTPENPRWHMVDVRFVKKFPQLISLNQLKTYPELAQMQLLRRGNRLSILPIQPTEWEFILNLGF
jgi:predicted RNA-binding protein with PUA-like domain